MSENPYLRSLVHHQARYGDYKPKEGDTITISLPSEMVRATIRKVSSDNAVVAEIIGVTMAKSHSYKMGDIVPVRRITEDLLKAEQWQVVSERELQLAEAAERFDRDEREKTVKEREADPQ